MSDETKAAYLAEHLVSITANLAEYIEEQAQAIAKPRIAEAHRNNHALLDQWRQDASVKDRRHADLLEELRRHIATLDKQVAARDALLRKVRAYADEIETKGGEREAIEIRALWNGSGVRP